MDYKESFVWGLELEGAERAGLGEDRHLGANRWPARPAEFKDTLCRYFAAAEGCAVDLLRGFALALGLPAEHFVRHRKRPIARASLTYYPPQPPDLGETQFGVAPHTDFGCLTVLCQDDVGGLQVQSLEGEWLTAHPIADTLVVNVGDLLSRWSNDIFRSTPHRVVNASGRERYSLVMAYDPDAETLVDPADLPAGAASAKYEPITCGDYIHARLNRSFTYRQD